MEEKMKPFVKQLSVANLFGRGILNIADDQPISDLFVYNPKGKC